MTHYAFTAFVANDGARTQKLVRVLDALCTKLVDGEGEFEVVDVRASPGAAEISRVLATPTVIRRIPGPERRAVGDISDPVVLAEALDVRLRPIDLSEWSEK